MPKGILFGLVYGLLFLVCQRMLGSHKKRQCRLHDFLSDDALVTIRGSAF